MAFWGIEVKPGKPFTHSSNKDRGRLHISQATSGNGPSTGKSLVQCNVGNKRPILLCALLPEKNESCHLDLEFDEVDDVLFSVIGPRSVHLTGYYLGKAHSNATIDDDSDTMGEDIGDADTDRSSYCSDENYEDSFIDDGELEIFPPSPASISRVSGESMQLMDSKLPDNGRVSRRQLKKKNHLEEADTDGFNCQKKIVNRRRAAKIVDSDDEDQRTISSLYKGDKSPEHGKLMEVKMVNETDEITDTLLEKVEEGADKQQNYSSTISHPDVEREVQAPVKPSLVSDDAIQEVKLEKKKKRKERLKEGVSEVDKTKCKQMKHNSSFKGELQEPVDPKQKDGSTHHAVNKHHSKDKKVKKKRKENLDDKANAEIPNSIKLDKNVPPSKVVENKKCSKLSNGLVLEELELGASDEKVASSGKKVTIQYDIKLKEGTQIVRSSVESGPSKFRLGKGRVIKGLDIGINGMREGGRRRLIVPPELGFGSEENDLGVPPNSWLIIDVDLIRVH